MSRLETLVTPPYTAEPAPLTVQLEPVIHLSVEELYEVCQLNPDLRIERTAAGELVIMPPTGASTGYRNARITAQLQNWADADGTGIAFDSSTAFELPNGAVRAPDAAWVGREHLTRLSEEEKQRFLPLCPDFVAELRSPSDSLVVVRMKMREYLEQGARLGWLIDPVERQVHVYRPGVPVEILEAPVTISGDPLLPGFELSLARIWSPGW